MSDIAIEINQVSKFYKLYDAPKDRLKEALSLFGKKYHKEFYALQDIDLKIHRGEILGVVGKNGSGKSTLLKLVSGVLQPNAGSISVDGKISALLELGAGFNPEFTGRQNIYFYATILGLTNAEIDKKLEDIIAFADIGDFIGQPLKSYSNGMRARLAFAVAVHIDPEILILDEVLAVGDALFRRKCFAKMEEFFKAGKTIIYVSHDANSVNQLCSRAVLLHQGRIILDGEPKEVTKYYEKLLFSKQDGHAAIVADLTAETKTQTKVSGAGAPAIAKHSDQLDKLALKPFLIDGLNPKSTVFYKDFDVVIQESYFLALSGEKVNCFVFGEPYRFKAKVLFNCDAQDVAFGFVIKDVRGQKVSSLESKKQYDYGVFIPKIREGSVIDIDIVFPCLFVNGDYFIDLGVSSFKNDQVILSRGVDLSMFRVINNELYSAGFVDIISNMKVQVDGQPAIELNNESRIV